MATYRKILGLFAVICQMGVNNLNAQIYAVNTYSGDSTHYPRAVETVFVDLESKSITGRIQTGEQGQIINKLPLKIRQGESHVLINAAMEGCYCDNAVVGQNRCRITVIDAYSFSLLRSFADSNIFITTLIQQPDNSIFISGERTGQNRQAISGDFILDRDYSLMLLRARAIEYAPGIYADIGSFNILEAVAPADNILYGIKDGVPYVVKVGDDRSIVMDSLILQDIPDRNHTLALMDTILYDFNLNWEFYGKALTKRFDEDRIFPHAILYDNRNFEIIDSIAVDDYPPGQYLAGGLNVAETMGPYLIYYDFEREGLTRFAPAMLFIFDTRTNETTWLRVGWR